MKEFEDNNFIFDEKRGKLSKRVENTVGKGKIARYEQFLLFPQCFQKTCTAVRKNQGLFGKGFVWESTKCDGLLFNVQEVKEQFNGTQKST